VPGGGNSPFSHAISIPGWCNSTSSTSSGISSGTGTLTSAAKIATDVGDDQLALVLADDAEEVFQV